jgi:hypothetical protein
MAYAHTCNLTMDEKKSCGIRKRYSREWGAKARTNQIPTCGVTKAKTSSRCVAEKHGAENPWLQRDFIPFSTTSSRHLSSGQLPVEEPTDQIPIAW